jgi:methanogenic corrinoid protein MtbC1
MVDLYSEILKFETMKNTNREELIENYAQQILDGMDMKTMECFVYDTLKENLESYSDEELLAEITEYNPELLEEVDTV